MIGSDELAQLLADPGSGLAVTPLIDAAGQLGEGSLDIRLGPDIIVSPRATGAVTFDPVDARAFRRNVAERQNYIRRGIGDPFQLQPGEFVIARSLEYVTLPEHVSAEARGRSSWGRLGLVIATATLIQPGFKGTITLELANVGDTPLMLSVGLSIAQLVFFAESSPGNGSPTDSDEDDEPSPDEEGNGAPSDFDEAARARVTEWRRRHRKLNAKTGRYKAQIKPVLSRLDHDKDLIWVAPLAVRYAIGVVGERFVGKSTVTSFLTDNRHFRLYRLSQFVFEEAQRRGLDARDQDVLRSVGDSMREEHGPDCLARLTFNRIRADLLDPERTRRPQAVVITGFLVPEELEAWLRLDIFKPLIVTASMADRRGWAEEARMLGDGYPRRRAGVERKDEWIRQEVDNEPGRPPPVDVVNVARESDKALEIRNRRGIRDLHDKLQKTVDVLERDWRKREY
jgi:dCTP deaminase